MMLFKKQILVILIAATCNAHAQDSLGVKKNIPERRHELGISILAPFLTLAGATDYNERYTNLTGRYFITNKHAVKAFVGVNILNSTPENKEAVSTNGATTVYLISRKTTPSNFQLGFGYEVILGKKKLKHVIGADILYNNKFEKEEFNYWKAQDSIVSNMDDKKYYTKLDTGSYVKANNYNKLGFNLSYSLRYELSKRWLITASTIMTSKFYRQRSYNSYSNNFDLNMVGLISDISIFYRF